MRSEGVLEVLLKVGANAVIVVELSIDDRVDAMSWGVKRLRAFGGEIVNA